MPDLIEIESPRYVPGLNVLPGRVRYSQLAGVDGDLFIYEDAVVEFPALRYVEGELAVLNESVISAPALARVDGGLFSSIRAKINAPALQVVHQTLKIGVQATLHAPKLTRIDRLIVSPGAVFDGPLGLQIQPGDDRARFQQRYRRRYNTTLATVPHARCAREGRCVEHERDPRVAACATKTE